MRDRNQRRVIGTVVATATAISTIATLPPHANASATVEIDAASVARNRLEAGLLSASLAEKLAVAGGRVRAVQLAETTKLNKDIKPQSGKATPEKDPEPRSQPQFATAMCSMNCPPAVKGSPSGRHPSPTR